MLIKVVLKVRTCKVLQKSLLNKDQYIQLLVELGMFMLRFV